MFERIISKGISLHVPRNLPDGFSVAFTERGGGASRRPYESLNLAGHVGDAPALVDDNRSRVLDALGLGEARGRLTTAEQVHGTRVVEVTGEQVGAGAYAGSPPGAEGASHPEASSSVPACDALWTREPGVPLMLFFADCVPVVLLRPSVPAVAVVHAGWRGAAAGIVRRACDVLRALPGPDDLIAYVGPHIGSCCYEVGAECVSHFDNRFVTITEVAPRLDLAAAIGEDLTRSGVSKESQWHLGICTAHNTDRFFSFRADGLTGRHAALAVIR